jgi:cytochrome b subunit of formate dehydrogenase
MWDGTVDENWAREHHRLWLEREAARGRVAPPPPAAHVQAAE